MAHVASALLGKEMSLEESCTTFKDANVGRRRHLLERTQKMDQQGRIDVADASTGAGSANYPPGASVYDADGEKLGTISDQQDKDDFLVVHKGRLFGHDAYIPRAAINHSDVNGVHLRVRKDDIKGMNKTPMPEPTAPIRHITGAPEAFAADQPPTIPMAPPVPMPDMGAAAVAATTFSDDATREPAPASGSPVQSAAGATQDAASHAVETARQGVGQATDFVREQTAPAIDTIREQVGPLVDTMRERVGPIADQVKDQASTVAQQQMTSAAEGLDSAAGAVNAVGDRLRENNLGELSQYTDVAAEQIEKLATWLRTTTPEEIAHDIEDFAKKQPAVFVAGALALGLIGVRFLRSTSQNADEKKND
jgi:hypothetical protein